MIFKNPHLLTHLDVWAPKYSTQYLPEGERVVLLACYKVDNASPWIIIEFTKAKHLIGQRYCVSRKVVRDCVVASNTKIPCYSVQMSKLERWDTVEEVKEIVNKLFP